MMTARPASLRQPKRVPRGGARQPVTVDVRDMLCAQALAVVARAVAALEIGQAAGVRYNAEDVRQDLVSWACELGHPVQALAGEPSVLRMTRGR